MRIFYYLSSQLLMPAHCTVHTTGDKPVDKMDRWGQALRPAQLTQADQPTQHSLANWLRIQTICGQGSKDKKEKFPFRCQLQLQLI